MRRPTGRATIHYLLLDRRAGIGIPVINYLSSGPKLVNYGVAIIARYLSMAHRTHKVSEALLLVACSRHHCG